MNSEIIRSLGMTLVHSLWQGLAVWVLIFFATSLTAKRSSGLRYTFYFSGLMLLLAGFFATWFILYHRSMPSIHTIVYAPRMNVLMPEAVKTTIGNLDPAGLASSVQKFLEPFYPSIAVGWTLGFIFMIVRMTGGIYYSYRIIHKEVILPELSVMVLFEKARIKLGMNGIINLRLINRMISPMVIGILRPCIIVPAAILSGLNTEQVEAILVHELAHIRRYDHIIMIIQAVATQVLFFHPVAWFLSDRIDRERENCCDDIVMNTFPNPINYIKALAMIQELNVTARPLQANALAGKSKNLLSRVKRLLRPETKHAPAIRLAAVLLLLVTLSIAAIAFSNNNNGGNSIFIAGIFQPATEKIQVAHDTIKNRAEQKAIKKHGTANFDEQREKKEMAEAREKLDRAQQQFQKAQQDLEKARQEVLDAKEKMRSGYLSSTDDSEFRARELQRMNQFLMDHNRDFQEQMKKMQENLSKKQAEINSRMQQFRHEDWERFKLEWQKSAQAMKKAMEDFYRSHKDSGSFLYGPHPFHIPPFPPGPPPVPPCEPNVEIPELPDVDMVSPDMNLIMPDVDVMVPEVDIAIPDLEHSLKILDEQREIENEKDPVEREKSDSLNSKLREAEGE